jgi:hypothetical protein
VRTGSTFFLYNAPKNEWLGWSPRIAVGKEPGPGEATSGR